MCMVTVTIKTYGDVPADEPKLSSRCRWGDLKKGAKTLNSEHGFQIAP